jgi:cell division ATPase FtsA
MGGGHITGDLSQCLKISFYQAEGLKRKVVLSLLASESDFYEIQSKDYMIPFSAKTTNEIV